ncbi:MAG TPA: LytTR family DNA-binding domain-containing protein [Burkholderiaceae bacterium]|nr:LytTR family DNA-binding domain-containing protein [Burkholderiaceae bacterium]
MQVLIVDDEALARKRLRNLLADCSEPSAQIVGEAANVAEAKTLLANLQVDAILLDINLPDADGLSLARTVQGMANAATTTTITTNLPDLAAPAIVFVTAHAEHAVQAFDLAALDYLTKPVRLERLQTALQKIEQSRQSIRRLEPENPYIFAEDAFVVHERGVITRIPLAEVLYLKAELKYISVRTASKTHILEGSLNDLETRFPAQFLRVHRNALVARHAIRALEKHYDDSEGDGWAVRLDGVDEVIAVSRRQLPAVRGLLGK